MGNVVFREVCGNSGCTYRGDHVIHLRDGRYMCERCLLKESSLSVRSELLDWQLVRLRDMVFKLFKLDKAVDWLSRKLNS